MTEYIIHIQNWRPHTANELLGSHWSKSARMKTSDAQMVGAMCHQAKVPKATGKRSIGVTMICHKGRALDQDAVQKSLLDALVRTGMLIDDSAIWLDFKGVTIQRGKQKATTITIGEAA